MFWLSLLAVTRRNVHYLRVLVNTAIISAIIFFCTHLFLSAYYSTNITWGTPVTIRRTDEGVIQLMESLELIQLKIQKLEAEITKLRKQATQLTLQEKYLNDHLYRKLIEIDRASRLNPVLLQRIGPRSNLHLRDVSGAAEALSKISLMETSVEQSVQDGTAAPEEATDLLALLKELRENFRTMQKSRDDLLEKLSLNEEAITQVQYQEPEDQPVPEPPPEPELAPEPEPAPELKPPRHYEPSSPPVQIPAPEPEPYVRSMSISDPDSDLLWSGHKLMGDVRAVLAQLVESTLLAVQKSNELLYYRKAARIEEGSALYRASVTEAPVLFMFMEQAALEVLQPGDPIFKCKFGLLWCDKIGYIKLLYPQAQKAAHPYTGRIVDGFLVEIELTDKKGGSSHVLHVHRPLF
jgi:hypothetical protein